MVARREFPALGFDPAPGDPVAVDSAAGSVDSVGRILRDASSNVDRLNSSGWTGEAADAFRDQLADLPRDLDLAARSHATTARTLTGYGQGLATRQRRAEELETRAAELRRQQQAAIAEVNRLAGQTAPQGSAQFAALKTQYDAARSRAEGLGGDLAEVIGQARRLNAEHEAAARTAAATIRDQADAPYREPGWLSRTRDSVKGWISDHADVLATISGVLKGIAAVLGVLSMVPGLQFLVPFAMAAGGIALAIDAAVKLATGKGSWATLALDTALTVLPAGRVANLVRKIPGVTRALDAAGGGVDRVINQFRPIAARTVGSSRDVEEIVRHRRWRLSPIPVWTDPKALAASPVPGGSARAIHRDSAHPRDLDALWRHQYQDLDVVNWMNLRTVREDGRSFRLNCVPCTVATDQTLDGAIVQAIPRSWKEARTFQELEEVLGGKFFVIPDYWHGVVRAMEEAGPGSRGAVGFWRRYSGSGHVFNVVNDARNGVVFLDGQRGYFASLAKNDLEAVVLNIYRK